MCKHEMALLTGTSDGIMCRGCGKLFKDFDELDAFKNLESGLKKEPPKPAPKKTTKKEAKQK